MAKKLTAEQAADRAGMTVDELMLSRARGLPPGSLGFKERVGGPLVWRSEDLLPAPPESAVCPDCGFVAKSPSGLATHRRKHG